MPTQPTILQAILKIGFIAGFMDITAAILQYTIMTGKNPLKIFNYIASGVFGKEIAYADNLWMPILGLIFHFLIAFTWAILFFLLYPQISKFSQNRFVNGVVYGLFVWVIMNRVIVPLSNTPKGPFNLQSAIVGAIILILCIGLPISLLTHYYYKSFEIARQHKNMVRDFPMTP